MNELEVLLKGGVGAYARFVTSKAVMDAVAEGAKVQMKAEDVLFEYRLKQEIGKIDRQERQRR